PRTRDRPSPTVRRYRPGQAASLKSERSNTVGAVGPSLTRRDLKRTWGAEVGAVRRARGAGSRRGLVGVVGPVSLRPPRPRRTGRTASMESSHNHVDAGGLHVVRRPPPAPGASPRRAHASGVTNAES